VAIVRGSVEGKVLSIIKGGGERQKKTFLEEIKFPNPDVGSRYLSKPEKGGGGERP